MAADIDDTGTIIDAARNRCSVLVKIDGKEETLTFSKKFLFSYGFQCEGDMTNILDCGTEVNVCYRLSKSRSEPTITLVWLGDCKPDQDTLDSELIEAVYGQEGVVDQVLDDTSYLVSSDDMISNVIIRQDIVYRDGCRSSTVLPVGEVISFDAVPSKSTLPFGAKYQGTCAWTGSHPRLVDRFSLGVKETARLRKVKYLQTNVIDGTVVAIPNDVVAFVEAEVENVAVKVILFRGSLSDKHDRMQDIVEVGERIRMRLRFGIIFRGKRQWFAAKAWKDGEKIPTDDQVRVDDKLAELESVAFKAQGPVLSESVDCGQHAPLLPTITNPGIFSTESVAGAGYPPGFYGNPTASLSYPAATGNLSSMFGYSNPSIYPPSADVLSMMYPSFSGVPIGMVNLPVGGYGLPVYVSANPASFAQGPPLVHYPSVQAQPLGTSFMSRSLPTAESATRIVERVATEPSSVISHDSFPAVMLATPDSRFTANSRILYNEPALTGIISKSNEKQPQSIIFYGNLLIASSRTVVYINQRQCSVEQFRTLIASGKTVVYFEARRADPKHLEKNKPTHIATCVWLGKKPTMVDLLSDMYQPEMSLLRQKGALYFGQVMKICLPNIALVELKSHKSTVCVHVSAFSREPQPNSELSSEEPSIAHFVKRRQWLSFKIVSVAACPIILTGTDVTLYSRRGDMKRARALYEAKKPKSSNRNPREVRPAESISTEDENSSPDSDFETARDTMPSAGTTAPIALSSDAASDSEITSTAKNLSSLQDVPKTGSDTTQSGNRYEASVFMVNSKPREMPMRFVNCSGRMHIEHEDGLTIYKVQPASGFLCVFLCTTKILEFCRRFNVVIAEHDGLRVKFNAECNYLENRMDFYISRIWWDTVICGVNLLRTVLARDEDPKFEYNVPLRAVITSTKQHDAAVAVFDDTPIIIPIDALKLSEQCSQRNHFLAVDQFLKIGDEVILTDVQTRFHLSRSSPAKLCYYVAGSCWKAVKVGSSYWDEIEMPETQEDPSWLDRWMNGEFSKEGRVVKRGDRYFVDVVSSKIPDLKLSLDVFEHSKFFVNGEPEESDSLSNLEELDMKFHIAHRRSLEVSDDIAGEFFVKYAWIGDDPTCLQVLKDELEVPDGLVVDGWSYVAVIEDFVLPTWMVCKIGVVPVMVYFPEMSKSVPEEGFQAEIRTRCKSQVVLKVRETFYKGRTYLEAESVSRKDTVYNENDVLIACKGKVIVPPRPDGVIRCEATKTTVCFHLCSVLPEKESILSRKERFKWFKYLKSAIKAGTQVCFSAAKDMSNNDYRAYKVWLD